jgi:hypothetical protein
VGSNPTGRVAREFYAKNAVTYDFDALAGGGLPEKKIAIFSRFFRFILCRVFIFAECFFSTRQSSLCISDFLCPKVLFSYLFVLI